MQKDLGLRAFMFKPGWVDVWAAAVEPDQRQHIDRQS